MFCLERKAALSFAVLTVLGLGFSAPPVSPVRAQPQYINSDYTFTSNITRPIVVNASNIVIDGNGYTLQGPGTTTGIGFYLDGKSNVTIKNVKVDGWNYGFNLTFSSGNTFSSNTIANSAFGIWLYMSNSSIVSGNTITDNANGIILEWSVGNNVSSNIINNSGNGIILCMSNSSIVSGNTITDNAFGIDVWWSVGNNVSGNTITSNEYGFYLDGSVGNIFYHNNIKNNAQQAIVDAPTGNDWHQPGLLEGNYWSNYPGVDDGSGTDKHNIAGDGIGDTNIPWPRTDFDNYPFVFESGWIDRVVTFSSSGLGGDGSGTVLTVDGANYRLSDLPKAFNWPVGSQHSFEWTSNVSDSPDKRYLWASTTGLSTERNGSITVPDGVGSVQASYRPQHYLTVNSPYGSPTGQGWYDDGSQAAIAVEPAVPMEGLQGTLGARWVFSQWTGDFTSTSPTANVPMDNPKQVLAVWTADYTTVGALLVLLGLGGAAVAAILKKRQQPASTT